jgi:hypothetical protein
MSADDDDLFRVNPIQYGGLIETWFARDSPLEGGVSCELVSESQPKPLAAFIIFYFATLKRAVQPAPVHRPRRKSL